MAWALIIGGYVLTAVAAAGIMARLPGDRLLIDTAEGQSLYLGVLGLLWPAIVVMFGACALVYALGWPASRMRRRD